MRILLVVACLSSLLTACAATRVTQPPPATPSLDIAESRTLYIYSQARLQMISGDLDGALALLRAAVEADPSSS